MRSVHQDSNHGYLSHSPDLSTELPFICSWLLSATNMHLVNSCDMLLLLYISFIISMMSMPWLSTPETNSIRNQFGTAALFLKLLSCADLTSDFKIFSPFAFPSIASFPYSPWKRKLSCIHSDFLSVFCFGSSIPTLTLRMLRLPFGRRLFFIYLLRVLHLKETPLKIKHDFPIRLSLQMPWYSYLY